MNLITDDLFRRASREILATRHKSAEWLAGQLNVKVVPFRIWYRFDLRDDYEKQLAGWIHLALDQYLDHNGIV